MEKFLPNTSVQPIKLHRLHRGGFGIPIDEEHEELQEIHQNLSAMVQRRLRDRMLDSSSDRSGLPHPPAAFTRELDRSITMSPRREHITGRCGTRSSFSFASGQVGAQTLQTLCPTWSVSSSLHNDKSIVAPSTPQGRCTMTRPHSRGTGRQLRPKSAPTNLGSRSGEHRRKTTSSIVQETGEDKKMLWMEGNLTLDDSSRDIFQDFDRYSMHRVGCAAEEKSESKDEKSDFLELEKILVMLRSRDRENQIKGIERLETFECNPTNVRIFTQQGHLEALCALTAVFLRQQQQKDALKEIGEDIATLPGFRALHIIFRIGAAPGGFRATATAMVALAMTHYGVTSVSAAQAATLVGDTDLKLQKPMVLPSVSDLLADEDDPFNLANIDAQQKLRWNPLSLNLQGLPHGNRLAVERVAVGSNLWVYTMGRTKKKEKSFRTFVQLLPTGSLFIGGKEQHVSLTDVLQGSSTDLDEAFRISADERACVFRVQAMPRDCALASCEPVSLAFGTSSKEECDCWVHGISVIILRHSAALPRTRAPLVKDKECQERDTVKGSSQPLSSPSYQGASDVHGVPQGHGIAVSPDGSKHIGNWRRGVLSGLGALILPWGDKYMGEWKDGLAHGVGVHLSKGGLRYEGQWLHDARHGYGIESNAHGLLFCGAYVDGERHGKGILFENSVARNCRYDRGALCSSEDQDAAARNLLDRDMDLSTETSEPRLAAEQAANKAKRVAIETSRLVMNIENDLIKSALVNGHTSASSSQPLHERLPVMI